MALRLTLMVPALLVAGVAMAQSAPQAKLPPGSDHWDGARPATASSAASSGDASVKAGKTEESHFKFKESGSAHPPRNDALEHSGKAPVMGGSEIGRDGRPTVSCANTPMDPACR